MKFNELHQVILDDDGIPELFGLLKEIRFDIANIDFDNYQGIVLTSNREEIQKRKKKLASTQMH